MAELQARLSTLQVPFPPGLPPRMGKATPLKAVP